MPTTVGDEGGFAPNLPSNEAALQLLVEAIDKAGYMPGTDIALALDCAASEFYKDGRYQLESEKRRAHVASSSPTCWRRGATSIRSSASRTACPSTTGTAGRYLTDRLGKKVQLVGDDLFVTNTKILKQGIAKGVANSILIKINQIGTLSETFAAITMANRAGYTAVISHRSGETEDSMIADIAVGTNAGQIKTGSLSRSDRIAKYNQLLRIEEDLGDAASYPGRDGLLPARSSARPCAGSPSSSSLLIAALQYPMWLGKGGWLQVRELDRADRQLQREANAKLKARNDALDADVRDLKTGSEAIEERARSELGMIRQDEVFFQLQSLRRRAESRPALQRSGTTRRRLAQGRDRRVPAPALTAPTARQRATPAHAARHLAPESAAQGSVPAHRLRRATGARRAAACSRASTSSASTWSASARRRR